MGIRAKLILSTCIPLLILYVIVLGGDYFASRQAALEFIETQVAQRAAADAAQLDGRLQTIQGVADRAGYALAGWVQGDVAHGAAPTSQPGLARGEPQEPGRGPNAGRGPGGGGGPLAGRFPNDRLFGRALEESISQLPRINAVWFRFDPAVPRVARAAEFGGLRRSGDENRPLAWYTPNVGPEAEWYNRPMREGKAMWLLPQDVHDPALGQSCIFAAPFYASQESQPAGVVCVSMPVEALRQLRQDTPVQSQLRQMLGGPAPASMLPTTTLGSPPSLAAGGYLLLDRTGNILSRPDGREQGSPLAVGPDDDELREAIERAANGRGAIVIAGGLNRVLGEMAPNARYVLAMEQLRSTGWLYVTAQAEAYLLGPVQARLIKRALFLAGSLGVLVGVIAIVLTRFCRPIEKMAARVHEMARGQLDIAPVPVLANDELGQLASGFNEMTGRLRHHVRELTEQSAEREKVDSELRIARQIQSDLLPRGCPPFPDRTEFALHAVNLPARHIAGDFYDYFFTGDDKLTLVIADVSGKGVPAALMMAVVRTMVRNLSDPGRSPREIVERVNRMLVDETAPGLFVTMILGQYEPATGQFTYVNAGHPTGICIHNGAAGACCAPTGPLLGVAIDSLGGFDQDTVTLQPGDTVLLYTDGVTEAHDETNVMFGPKRLLEVVNNHVAADPPDLCERIVETVMGYQHQSPADDLTLIALRRR